MKKKICAWMFKLWRREFDDLYIADMIGDIPPEVSENTLRFLVTGKKQLDRWLRWEAYVLQRKLQRPLKNSEAYFGGLVFIQTLGTLLARMEMEKRIFPGENNLPPTSNLVNELEGVNAFLEPKGREKS